MRTIAALAAALVLVPAALAQEPPTAPAAGARHVNRISDEAKALLEAGNKRTYSPIALGLKSLKGTIEQKQEMKMGGMPDMPDMPNMPNMPKMPGMGGETTVFGVEFTAPDTLKVDMKEEAGGGMGGRGGPGGPGMGGEMMKKGRILPVRMNVLNSLGILGQPSDSEYDAVVETEGAQKVLVMTMYEKDVKQGTMRMYFGENGLPARATMKPEGMGGGDAGSRGRGGMGGQGFQIDWTYEWGKEGERFYLQKTSMKMPMSTKPTENLFTYADVGGYKLLTGWSSAMNVETQGHSMQTNTTTRYTDLEVNGKKIEVPAAPGVQKMVGPGRGKGGEMGGDDDGENEGDDEDGKDDDDGDDDDGDDDDKDD